jgi:Tfp pilus assembly protein PilX
MRTIDRHKERGITLILAILALLMLTAIAATFLYMSTAETSISGNFKTEESNYFAARAGVEEARDRMLTNTAAGYSISGSLPTVLPNNGQGVLYLLQTGVSVGKIVTAGNSVTDDELCHDYTIGSISQSSSPNVSCTATGQPGVPGTGLWYNTVNSFSQTNPSWYFPLDYKWVRVSLKGNNSNKAYPVDGNASNSQIVCWNGTSEVNSGLATLPLSPTTQNACNSASAVPSNPVYLLTSLAISQNGARRMVQEEISVTPHGNAPYGLYATSSGCGAITMGGGSSTYAFDSSTAGGAVTAGTTLTTGANIGAAGNITQTGNNNMVNGTVYSGMNNAVGSCVNGAGAGLTANNTCPPWGSPSSTLCYKSTQLIPSLPSISSPTSSCPVITNNVKFSTIPNPLSGGAQLGNVNVTAGKTLTLSGGTKANPAVICMNSLSLAGGANLTVASGSYVVLNVVGQGQNNPVNLTGGTFTNSTYIPSAFTINYAGTKNISVAGGSGSYMVIDAPNANVSMSGGSSIYGQVIGNTISMSGGTNFYYDISTAGPVTNDTNYKVLAMRELSY